MFSRHAACRAVVAVEETDRRNVQQRNEESVVEAMTVPAEGAGGSSTRITPGGRVRVSNRQRLPRLGRRN